MPALKYTHWISPEGQEQIRELVKQGLSDAKISTAIGVDKSQLSAWRKKYPQIRDALTRYTDADTHQALDRHEIIKASQSHRLLSNVDILRRRIDEWEQARKEKKLPLTLSSLCLFLGITKATLNRHLNNNLVESHVYTTDPITGERVALTVQSILQDAKLRAESELEDRMITGNGNTAGIMFDLKNHHGYVDRQTVETETKPIKKDDKTDDERIEELLKRRDGDALKLVN